jgi:hypothetical protein
VVIEVIKEVDSVDDEYNFFALVLNERRIGVTRGDETELGINRAESRRVCEEVCPVDNNRY